jgi:hypothetical protein
MAERDRLSMNQCGATQEQRKINWRFTRAKAREKFHYSPVNSTAGRD